MRAWLELSFLFLVCHYKSNDNNNSCEASSVKRIACSHECVGLGCIRNCFHMKWWFTFLNRGLMSSQPFLSVLFLMWPRKT